MCANRAEPLPVEELRDTLPTALARSGRLMVEAPTGSGKSTRIPPMLLESGAAGTGQIAVLQPRRIAARLLARRVSEERDTPLGGETGYQVRYENRTTPGTRIRYVTEGVLLRELISHPDLRSVSILVFDEFHERRLTGDLLLARAKQLQETTRPDLKLVIMSATLDAGPLHHYLAPCETLRSEGRTWPVEVHYSARPALRPDRKLWDRTVACLEAAAPDHPEGDWLIFMPGAYEIGRTLEALRHSPAARGFTLLPLHGELPPEQQDLAVRSSADRKIIVATNVAETSITLPGIRMVIDSGLARMAHFDAGRGMDTLRLERISRAAADQRAGRAGRTAPGHCYRLWTAADHAARRDYEIPEVRRSDLAEPLLALKAAGVGDATAFPWFEAPDPQALQRAEQLLHDLGALEPDGLISPAGKQMLAFPLHPRYARMLLEAAREDCVRQACLAAALAQEGSLFLRNTARRTDRLPEENDTSDFHRLIQAWQFADRVRYDTVRCAEAGIRAQTARQIKPAHDRFLRLAQAQGLPLNNREPDEARLRRCLLTAFSDQAARRLDHGTLRCELVRGRRGDLARDSVVQQHPLFVATKIHEIEGGGGKVTVRLSNASAIEEAWLEEFFPHDLHTVETVLYDPAVKRVFTERCRCFRDLALETKRVPEADPEKAAQLLSEEILEGRLDLPQWTDDLETWITRVNCLAAWCPELQIDPIDREARRAMLQEICLGAFSRKELKTRPVRPVVKSWLPPAMRELLDKQLPEHLRLPSGLNARVRYETGVPPVLSATIQKLYGLEENPRIAFGKIPVVIEALAPNMRPQQKTTDLRSFWQNTYPLLKKELRGRYPKHEWR